jgi:pilus assembly protein Flp/PilA
MMIRSICCFFKDNEGATMLEYGLMVALIAVASIVAVGAFGSSVQELFELVNQTVNG